jgi:hypothetical protein
MTIAENHEEGIIAYSFFNGMARLQDCTLTQKPTTHGPQFEHSIKNLVIRDVAYATIYIQSLLVKTPLIVFRCAT